MEKKANVSLVTYNTKEEDVLKVIDSVFCTKLDCKLMIIDNSPDNKIESLISTIPNVEYIFNNSNLGFGAGHNIAINKSIERDVKYHFVVNPDVYFSDDVMKPMVDFMEKDSSIGMMMPQVLNDDRSIQNLPKLLPTPFSILIRKLKFPREYYNKFINKYELRFVDSGKVYNTPILSGCFTLLNVEAIKKVGLYDDSFFMYFEDWDLSRRMHEKYKTIYFPLVRIYHGYESGANRSSRLFKIFLKSAYTYFNKWGWFFDKKRNEINKKALDQFK